MISERPPLCEPFPRLLWTSLLSFALVVGVGCGSLSPGLGVPHEDPEPIGSAPWETGAPDTTDADPHPDADAQARTLARNKARRGKHDKGSDSAASKPASSSSPPNPGSPAPPAKVDTDGDGVEDARDQCPRTPGADDQNPAYAGCPYDAPPRPTPSQFEALDVAFGDAPDPRDPRETEAISVIGDNLKTEPTITVSTHARTKSQADAWLKFIKAGLVASGVDASRIVTQVCLEPAGLTHSVVSRGAKTCGGP